jgi:hypothetical protein
MKSTSLKFWKGGTSSTIGALRFNPRPFYKHRVVGMAVDPAGATVIRKALCAPDWLNFAVENVLTDNNSESGKDDEREDEEDEYCEEGRVRHDKDVFGHFETRLTGRSVKESRTPERNDVMSTSCLMFAVSSKWHNDNHSFIIVIR